MGLYSLKIHQGEKVLDTGVRVAAAVEGVDFTEWQGMYITELSLAQWTIVSGFWASHSIFHIKITCHSPDKKIFLVIAQFATDAYRKHKKMIL